MFARLKVTLQRATARLNAVFGRGLVVAMSSAILAALVISLAVFGLFNTAAPTSLTIASGRTAAPSGAPPSRTRRSSPRRASR
jgi:hypothetical protein